jgi:hypothetical protein
MKTSKASLKQMIVACAVSLCMAAPLVAQQEISPDRFEEMTSVQQRTAAQKTVSAKTAAHQATNKQSAKVQKVSQTKKQTAYANNPSGLEQIARK